MNPVSKKSRRAVIMFDSGSSHSHVSSRLAHSLDLPHHERRVQNVSTFGSETPMAIKGFRTFLVLRSAHGRCLQVNVTALDCIVSSVRTALVRDADLPPLRRSDCLPITTREMPDLLIGQDLVHLFDRQLEPTLRSGYYVVRTSLGPTIGGASRSVTQLPKASTSSIPRAAHSAAEDADIAEDTSRWTLSPPPSQVEPTTSRDHLRPFGLPACPLANSARDIAVAVHGTNEYLDTSTSTSLSSGQSSLLLQASGTLPRSPQKQFFANPLDTQLLLLPANSSNVDVEEVSTANSTVGLPRPIQEPLSSTEAELRRSVPPPPPDQDESEAQPPACTANSAVTQGVESSGTANSAAPAAGNVGEATQVPSMPPTHGDRICASFNDAESSLQRKTRLRLRLPAQAWPLLGIYASPEPVVVAVLLFSTEPAFYSLLRAERDFQLVPASPTRLPMLQIIVLPTTFLCQYAVQTHAALVMGACAAVLYHGYRPPDITDWLRTFGSTGSRRDYLRRLRYSRSLPTHAREPNDQTLLDSAYPQQPARDAHKQDANPRHGQQLSPQSLASRPKDPTPACLPAPLPLPVVRTRIGPHPTRPTGEILHNESRPYQRPAAVLFSSCVSQPPGHLSEQTAVLSQPNLSQTPSNLATTTCCTMDTDEHGHRRAVPPERIERLDIGDDLSDAMTHLRADDRDEPTNTRQGVPGTANSAVLVASTTSSGAVTTTEPSVSSANSAETKGTAEQNSKTEPDDRSSKSRTSSTNKPKDPRETKHSPAKANSSAAPHQRDELTKDELASLEIQFTIDQALLLLYQDTSSRSDADFRRELTHFWDNWRDINWKKEGDTPAAWTDDWKKHKLGKILWARHKKYRVDVLARELDDRRGITSSVVTSATISATTSTTAAATVQTTTGSDTTSPTEPMPELAPTDEDFRLLEEPEDSADRPDAKKSAVDLLRVAYDHVDNSQGTPGTANSAVLVVSKTRDGAQKAEPTVSSANSAESSGTARQDSDTNPTWRSGKPHSQAARPHDLRKDERSSSTARSPAEANPPAMTLPTDDEQLSPEEIAYFEAIDIRGAHLFLQEPTYARTENNFRKEIEVFWTSWCKYHPKAPFAWTEAWTRHKLGKLLWARYQRYWHDVASREMTDRHDPTYAAIFETATIDQPHTSSTTEAPPAYYTDFDVDAARPSSPRRGPRADLVDQELHASRRCLADADVVSKSLPASRSHATRATQEPLEPLAVVSTPQCAFCGQFHQSCESDAYRTVSQRLQRARRLKCCFTCLGQGHRTSSCSEDTIMCCLCRRGPHHEAFCRHAAPSAAAAKTDECSSRKAPTVSVQIAATRAFIGNPPAVTASSTMRRACAFCQSPHCQSEKCNVYVSINQRLNRVRVLDLCFMCLRQGHHTTSCPSSNAKPCTLCSAGSHHRALCRRSATSRSRVTKQSTDTRADGAHQPMKRVTTASVRRNNRNVCPPENETICFCDASTFHHFGRQLRPEVLMIETPLSTSADANNFVCSFRLTREVKRVIFWFSSDRASQNHVELVRLVVELSQYYTTRYETIKQYVVVSKSVSNRQDVWTYGIFKYLVHAQVLLPDARLTMLSHDASVHDCRAHHAIDTEVPSHIAIEDVKHQLDLWSYYLADHQQRTAPTTIAKVASNSAASATPWNLSSTMATANSAAAKVQTLPPTPATIADICRGTCIRATTIVFAEDHVYANFSAYLRPDVVMVPIPNGDRAALREAILNYFPGPEVRHVLFWIGRHLIVEEDSSGYYELIIELCHIYTVYFSHVEQFVFVPPYARTHRQRWMREVLRLLAQQNQVLPFARVVFHPNDLQYCERDRRLGTLSAWPPTFSTSEDGRFLNDQAIEGRKNLLRRGHGLTLWAKYKKTTSYAVLPLLDYSTDTARVGTANSAVPPTRPTTSAKTAARTKASAGPSFATTTEDRTTQPTPITVVPTLSQAPSTSAAPTDTVEAAIFALLQQQQQILQLLQPAVQQPSSTAPSTEDPTRTKPRHKDQNPDRRE